jgi:hypothetical protein
MRAAMVAAGVVVECATSIGIAMLSVTVFPPVAWRLHRCVSWPSSSRLPR